GNKCGAGMIVRCAHDGEWRTAVATFYESTSMKPYSSALFYALRYLLACLFTLLISWACPAQSETLLIDQGRPLAEIVVAENADPATKLAAAQLQEHLLSMTGVKLPLVAQPGDASVSKIYVGPSPFIEALGVRTSDLQHDAYRVVSGDHWLVLAGRDRTFF